MKIQSISTYKVFKPSFKKYTENQDWHDDYGTYYNHMSIKDAFISAGLVSTVCFLGTTVLTKESEIKNAITKCTNKLSKLFKKC